MSELTEEQKKEAAAKKKEEAAAARKAKAEEEAAAKALLEEQKKAEKEKKAAAEAEKKAKAAEARKAKAEAAKKARQELVDTYGDMFALKLRHAGATVDGTMTNKPFQTTMNRTDFDRFLQSLDTTTFIIEEVVYAPDNDPKMNAFIETIKEEMKKRNSGELAKKITAMAKAYGACIVEDGKLVLKD